MVIDVLNPDSDHEMIRDPDSESYARNCCWALADFECPHGLFPEDCKECR